MLLCKDYTFQNEYTITPKCLCEQLYMKNYRHFKFLSTPSQKIAQRILKDRRKEKIFISKMVHLIMKKSLFKNLNLKVFLKKKYTFLLKN